MAFLGGNFDANTVEPQGEIGPIPTGDYAAHIIDSDLKDTKNGAGKYLELTHEITEGPMKGRKVWARLNIQNQNRTAEEIAQRQLSAICHATGVMQVSDSQQLHYKPLVIRVEFVPAGPKNDRDQNEIRAWKSAGGAAPAQTTQAKPAQQTTAAPATQQPAANAAPPWVRAS